MSSSKSSCESGEEVDYENSYDCNTDSDSECVNLIENFDSLFGDNCFKKKIEKKECQAGSSANSLDSYDETWKKWALNLFPNVRGNIRNYNNVRAFFFINAAGYYGNVNDSGIGVLIRNRQGIPIAACSYYEDNNDERVSAFFQELRAVSRSLDMAEELDLKYIHIICTSTDVSYAMTSCDRGAPIEDQNQAVYNLSLEIIDKLQKRRDKYQKEDGEENIHFYFSNFAGGKIDNIAARYLARLKENESDIGPEMLSKYDDLMDMIFKDATGLSDVTIFSG